jgi:endonuclease/exonuclease/phosphatase family metal-dependent hydrolase
MRRLLTTLASPLLALAACAPMVSRPPAAVVAPVKALRVMTYNIKHGQSNAPCVQPPPAAGRPVFPDCNLALDGTMAVIRAHAPDIVALQEVDRFWARSGYVDQPAALAAGLRMEHSCYAANLDHPADSHADRPHQYGTAIVSRFPLTECRTTPLTTFAGWEQRGLLGARATIDGSPIRVYSTHLQAGRAVSGASESGQPQRVLQVEDVMRVLAGVTEPVVLMGDFNAVPAAAEMAPLLSRMSDAWGVAGTGKGETSGARLDRDPVNRIDYIFVSSGLAVSAVSVPVDSSTRLASDHYPIVATLAWPPRK